MEVILRNIAVGLLVGAVAGGIIGLMICVWGMRKTRKLATRVRMNGEGTLALKSLVEQGPRDSGTFEKAK